MRKRIFLFFFGWAYLCSENVEKSEEEVIKSAKKKINLAEILELLKNC